VSSFLFYGPGARKKALSREKEGRRIGGPFGEEGLKIEEARTIIRLLDNLPPGRKKCTFVIGPMNRATPAASDVLLKSLEEPPGKVEMVLWAEDLSSVLPTITSRCWAQWCYGEEVCEMEEEARLLILYLGEGKIAEASKLLEENKKSLEEFLRSVPWVLSEDQVEDSLVWSGVRENLLKKKVTFLNTSTSLLFGL